ncbi:PREDICTED: hepatic lectin-like [Cyprinodon variegatus]|uniref:hepatic lectin-like n=1 Tax=Cyprinodon variegatus TaxID=28743 RepID=UPI000742BF7F|nr:PREDICTED: hepatic lectin-like [Cyprinodon variegatus]
MASHQSSGTAGSYEEEPDHQPHTNKLKPQAWLQEEMCLNNRPEWERYQGKCYKFNTRKSSWNESRDSCRAQGGDLVKIDSRDEQIFLEIRLRDWMEEGEDKFWIGLTDSEEEGKWLWVDGSPLDKSLTFWMNKEPDDWKEMNPAGEDCVRMGLKGGAGDLKCWFDISCDVHHKSICEKSIVPGLRPSVCR